MSAQVLPVELKQIIKEKINRYNFDDTDKIEFYVNHMFEKDLWNEYGKTFISYLNDLDTARNISWKHSFKEMKIENYTY